MMSRVFTPCPPSLVTPFLFVLPVHLLLTVITNLLPLHPLLSLHKHIPSTSKHIFQDLISLFQTTFMNVKSWTEPNPSPSSGKKLGAITCSKQSRHILSSFILFPRNTWLRDFCLKDEQNLVFYPPPGCSITVVLFLVLFVV